MDNIIGNGNRNYDCNYNGDGYQEVHGRSRHVLQQKPL